MFLNSCFSCFPSVPICVGLAQYPVPEHTTYSSFTSESSPLSQEGPLELGLLDPCYSFVRSYFNSFHKSGLKSSSPLRNSFSFVSVDFLVQHSRILRYRRAFFFSYDTSMVPATVVSQLISTDELIEVSLIIIILMR